MTDIKYKSGDRVVDLVTGHRYTVLNVFANLHVKAVDAPYHDMFLHKADVCLDPDARIKSTVRLEKRGPSTGRVWIDTAFDGCKLQSLVVFSGDYTIAQGIFDGRYRLTPESYLVDAATGEKIKWH
jgi:hypothetical protein